MGLGCQLAGEACLTRVSRRPRQGGEGTVASLRLERLLHVQRGLAEGSGFALLRELHHGVVPAQQPAGDFCGLESRAYSARNARQSGYAAVWRACPRTRDESWCGTRVSGSSLLGGTRVVAGEVIPDHDEGVHDQAERDGAFDRPSGAVAGLTHARVVLGVFAKQNAPMNADQGGKRRYSDATAAAAGRGRRAAASPRGWRGGRIVDDGESTASPRSMRSWRTQLPSVES
jgi:hypothetical protein